MSRQIELRSCGPGDRAALVELHDRTFGGRRSNAYWAWRFGDHAAARSRAIGAFDRHGRCYAVHAGIVMRFWCAGTELRAMDHNDVIVDPELRRGLGGARLLLATTRRQIEQHCGGDTALLWGYPHPRLKRLLTERCGLTVVTDLVLLGRPTDRPLAAPAVELREVTRCGADLDRLWARIRGQLEAAVVRDAAFLNWRFAEHPAVAYRMLEARGGDGELRGFAVLRSDGWEPSALTLAEWLVPRGADEVAAALLARAIEVARRDGKAYVACCFAPSGAEWRLFRNAFGFAEHATSHQLAVRSWRPLLSPAWLAERWYQTASDVDFL